MERCPGRLAVVASAHPLAYTLLNESQPTFTTMPEKPPAGPLNRLTLSEMSGPDRRASDTLEAIPPERLRFVGHNLARPECVVCTPDGSVHVADWRGGVTTIDRNGDQSTLLADAPGFALRPNGIAIAPGGGFLIAHLGPDVGGVFHLWADGRLSPILTELDGTTLPPTNFVHPDPTGRLWVTVSTRLVPRDRAYRADVADGFIVLVDRGTARVVADGLGYTNECLLDPTGERLYVNETFARRLTSFAVGPDGSLTDRRTEAAFGDGMFPDGLAFDAEGGLWVVSIVSNRVVRLNPDGTRTLIVDEADATHVAWVEQAYRDGAVGRPHLDRIGGRCLPNISSIAFGGPGRRTAYLGCLLGSSIASFDSPVAGAPLPHWPDGIGPAVTPTTPAVLRAAAIH